MLTLIREGNVLAPEPIGVRDILVADERIAAVAEPGSISISGVEVDEIEVDGNYVLPGLVDSHVHLIGGGGEGGPGTRLPEIRVEDIVGNGVTTVIGCLGTDGITRHTSTLVAKARGLECEGISAHVFVGSYEVPVQTLTGSVRSDLVLIDKVLGAGEIAISDQRSSQPTFDELARLAADCLVGGSLGGKAGILHLHLGDGAHGLEPVFRIVRETEIPVTQIIPTHCNRNAQLLDEALQFATEGGLIDLTAGFGENGWGITVETAVQTAIERGVPLDRISVSSDGNGSLVEFDGAGNLAHIGAATQASLLNSLRGLVQGCGLGIADACAPFTSNPAQFYRLERKGRVAVGMDADLLVLDQELKLKHVLARGRLAVREGQLILRSLHPTPG